MKIGMWLLMLACNLIVPAAMAGLGQQFTKNPPKTIDPMCGYRTVMSMKNQDTWQFAQAQYGRTCYQVGWAALALTALFLFLMWRLRIPVESIDYVFWQGGFILLEMVVLVIASYVPVERALRREFDQHGVRRRG